LAIGESMKLVVGLGNPGREYERTRHNVGFEVLASLADRHRASWSKKANAEIARWGAEAVLVRPQTFMNLSGPAVQHWGHFYRVAIEDMLVVYDDVNLEAGRLRIRQSGSAGGHNGMKSIIQALGSDQFPRLRVGIGGGEKRSLSSHVLGKFGPEEEAVIEAAIGRAVEAVEAFVAEGIVAAMNQYNRKDDQKNDGEEKDT
jgi:PTH1 family peptidyl-tRNA hydrolase